MQKLKVLLLLVSTTLFFSETSAHAQNCAISAIKAAKAAGGNTTTLKGVYATYFGEVFAKHVAGAAWNKPNFDRAALVERAQNTILTLAHHLAPYADADFVWQGDIGLYTLNGERGTVRIYPSGDGCKLVDICIKGKGCLSSYVQKSSMTVEK